MNKSLAFRLIVGVLLTLLLSCTSTPKKGLTLNLNNKEILVYPTKGDSITLQELRKLDNNNYPSCAANIIQIEFDNSSDESYFITAQCAVFGNIGCYLPSSEEVMNISNFEFKDSKNKIVPIETGTIFRHQLDQSKLDSITLDFYHRMNYDYKISSLPKPQLIKENTLFIPANQKVYLESLIYFPFSSSEGNQGLVRLDKNKEYFASVVIRSDTTNISKYFPREFIRTIKSNNYKFYQGNLKSNSVKVKFLDRDDFEKLLLTK
jgi:hypothetical protein